MQGITIARRRGLRRKAAQRAVLPLILVGLLGLTDHEAAGQSRERPGPASSRGDHITNDEAAAFLERYRNRETPPDHPSGGTLGDRLVEIPINQWLFLQLWLNSDRRLYAQEEVNAKLRAGGLQKLGGLTVQPLGINLPLHHRRCWSEDGQTLYVVSPLLGRKGFLGSSLSQVVRIDIRTWTATHVFRFQSPRKAHVPITGLTLTSEGLLVSIKGHYKRELIRKRNGVRIDPEGPVVDVAINHLVLLKPDTLEMKKLFLGPAWSVTGSPSSPVACVEGNGVIAALVDLSNGEVLDRIDSENQAAKTPDIPRMDDFRMSPDGALLYCTGDERALYRIDISGGRFNPISPLACPGRPSGVSLGQGNSVHIAPDGSHVAVRCSTSSDKVSYAIVPTSYDGPPGIDAPTPPLKPARGSTDFSFVGPGNLEAFSLPDQSRNLGPLGSPQESASESELPKFELANEGGRYKFLCEVPRLGTSLATLCGSPLSNHLLIGISPITSNEQPTLWVRLPGREAAPEPTQAAEVEPGTILGREPEDPLVLLDRPRRDHFDDGVGLARVHVPNQDRLACSPDGSLVYVLDENSLLRAFDTNKLREVRRAELLSGRPDQDRGVSALYVTKAGLLVGEYGSGSVTLLDTESLDSIGRFDFDPDDILATSPGTNLIRVRSESEDLELYDLKRKRLAVRYSQQSMSEQAEEPGRRRRRPGRRGGGGFRETVISDSGRALVTQGQDGWHYFDIKSRKGLEHRGLLEGSDRWDRDMRVIPLPEIRKCCVIRQSSPRDRESSECGVTVYDVKKLPEPSEEFELRGEAFMAIGAKGWIYTSARAEPNSSGGTLNVYDLKGKRLFSQRVLTQARGGSLASLPGRPTRVFALGSSLSVADLDKPRDQFEGLRIWTSGKYKTVAKLVKSQGDKAVLQSLEGKQLTVPLKLLSEEDRDFIASLGNTKEGRGRNRN